MKKLLGIVVLGFFMITGCDQSNKISRIIESCSKNQNQSVGRANERPSSVCMSLLYNGRQYICPYSSELLDILEQKLSNSDIPQNIFTDLRKKRINGMNELVAYHQYANDCILIYSMFYVYLKRFYV